MNNRTRSLLVSKQEPQATPEPRSREREEFRSWAEGPEGSLEQLSPSLMKEQCSEPVLLLRAGNKSRLPACLCSYPCRPWPTLQGSRTKWGGKGELNHCIPIFFAALFFCQVASDFLKAFPHDQVCVSLKLKPTWMVLDCKSFHSDSLLAWGRTPQSCPSLQSLPVLFLGFRPTL